MNTEIIRRIDMLFGIGCDDNIELAEKVLHEIVDNYELVLDEPPTVIQLHTLGDSSVDFIVRPWVKTSEYWTAYWFITRAVKKRFDDEGISLPFPQQDIHVYASWQRTRKSNDLIACFTCLGLVHLHAGTAALQRGIPGRTHCNGN